LLAPADKNANKTITAVSPHKISSIVQKNSKRIPIAAKKKAINVENAAIAEKTPPTIIGKFLDQPAVIDPYKNGNTNAHAVKLVASQYLVELPTR
jgi:hypothetical protein